MKRSFSLRDAFAHDKPCHVTPFAKRHRDARRDQRLTRGAYAASEASLIRPARTSRPGSAPVCSPRSKIGVPATSVAS